jgi:hypothetical protein
MDFVIAFLSRQGKARQGLRGLGASRLSILDSCAHPPVRFWSRSGAGKGTRTGHPPREAVRHGQARARLPRGVRASSLWHGPAGFPRSKPQVQLHQSQMNDTLLSTDGAAARLHTVRRRTHGSFGSSRTCARGWFLAAAAAGCCYYCYCWHCLCLLLLGA